MKPEETLPRRLTFGHYFGTFGVTFTALLSIFCFYRAWEVYRLGETTGAFSLPLWLIAAMGVATLFMIKATISQFIWLKNERSGGAAPSKPSTTSGNQA